LNSLIAGMLAGITSRAKPLRFNENDRPLGASHAKSDSFLRHRL
jgi:hypothetical protein